ncbi:polyketide synthase [Penicillium cinerascens]|uniref:Polyketide synthase n=1 Tax=Penicillium cinerascens TaxID=70096 RepID=A0A9W9MNP8_9EURO|nr:polyketide synthase [Penicillium cinerascens]KAJ5204653.1 polyketide synthase [Penicillium cinerascens]
MPFVKEEEVSLEPIAIVGMACRLPGSVDSVPKFWDMLREQRSVKTPRVPSNRFNIDAHYHPDLSRPGSFSALGGYFLDGNLEDFDCTFFNMTPVEAQWLDPQQRKMLEVSYECIENAGLRLDQVAGTNTAVYVASFTSDYQQMSIFERDFRHNYAATGVDVGIISNRINNTFNLNGPSFTINTACSSSVYAIHNACLALRARDCDAAITGGVNLVLIVDQHMNTAKLGVLSPTSECHTFDQSADGYGRAEGVGALYLKRLSDAMRDGDVIRGVIRSSAVNTNGKVEGMGITFPNVLGQERVLRQAYKRANLDPSKTAYLECHGTGTPSGDPIEVRAVSAGMNDTRDSEKPLLLGAVKSNIGHSEAASGIFATMKAALSTEKGQIPGVHGFQTLNPNIKEKEWNVKIVTEHTAWPTDFDVRRASVSSFGYGGTNAHLVIEAVESLCPWYEHGQPKASAKYEYQDGGRPFLVTMSAHDEVTLTRNIQSHQKIAGGYHLPDLAYTLNCRRTRFASRAYTIAFADRVPEAFDTDSFCHGSQLDKPSKVGLVFTGQGAQWARMGYDAMQHFPHFLQTIDTLDQILSQTEPAPNWSLRAVLEAAAKSSPVNNAEISQPACTAIQIAMVDLLVSWGVDPAVTVGHSSGEIAAAYAAGRISAPEAILAAYFRGLAVARAASAGTMLAVGLGATEIEDYIPEEVAGSVTIACDNSPKSVTLSGRSEDIAIVKGILDETGDFNRELKTGKAYHSPHMDDVAPLYSELYSNAHPNLTKEDLAWRQPFAPMVSSVTGAELAESDLGISYWCENLRNRVQFNSAVTTLIKSESYADVDILVEIGPHPALAGPLKQVFAAEGLQKHHVATFKRGADSAIALLKTVGELYLKGVDVQFDLINNIQKSVTTPRGPDSKGKSSTPKYLPDLPSYQWNYDKQYWNEPRAVAELRRSKHPRHDILGRKIFGLSANASTWKNILRQRDVEWFSAHNLGTDTVFPAAGHISLAIEALLQQLDIDPHEAAGVTLRDISMPRALLIPDDDQGIEVHTRLQQAVGGWYAFSVESTTTEGLWTIHSTGKIRKQSIDGSTKRSNCPYEVSQLHRRVPGKLWYRAFDRVGFHYGSSFQCMENVRANGKDRVAAAEVKVRTESGSINQESRYMLHPSTIDGCLHAVIASVHRGLHKEMAWGVVPLEIEQMTVNFPDQSEMDSQGRCLTWTENTRARYFQQNVELFSSQDRCLLRIQNLKLVIYDAAVPATSASPRPKNPYSRISWEEISTAVNSPSDSSISTVVVSSSGLSLLATHLNTNCTSLSNDLHGLPCDTVIVDETEGSILANPSAEIWDNLKSVLTSGKPIVWITRGANQGDCAEAGIAQGFLRVVRSEMAAAKIVLLDVDREINPTKLACEVQHYLSTAAALISGKDNEFWLTKDETTMVARITPDDDLVSLVHHEEPHQTTPFNSGAYHIGHIEGDEVVFETNELSTHPLLPLEAEIQVSHSELSKEDLSTGASDRGRVRIVTGTVERVGAGLDTSLLGRTVAACAKTLHIIETRLVTSHFVVMDSKAMAYASSLPYLCKAVDAVLCSASATSGDHLLVLPGSPLLRDAISKLGAQLGFQVSIAEDNIAHVEEIFARSEPPTIVVASSPSSLIPDVWSCIPAGSKLVLSDIELDGSLDSRPFARGANVSFRGIAKAYDNNNGLELQDILKKSVAALSNIYHVCTEELTPCFDVGELTNIEHVRQEIAKTGSGVVNILYGQSQIKSRAPRPKVRFSSDSAYILVGCLGGLGRSLTTWMLERGCRDFVFLSRSGTATAEAAGVVKRLEEAGASVGVFCVDASDEAAVTRVVADVSSTRPIRGVIDAAMVLRDGLYKSMTVEQYHAALKPKMQVALALDRALGTTTLDFFIMTSSLSAVLGNPGQANYCAGNSYLDFLALCRRKRGLAGCSIALPMIEDVGVVAENVAIADSLTRKNPFGIDEREMLIALEVAIVRSTVGGAGQSSSNQSISPISPIDDARLVLGLEPLAVMAVIEASAADMSDAYWVQDARLGSLRAALESLAAEKDAAGGGAQGARDGAQSSITSASLAGKSRTEVMDILGTHIMGRTARILGMQSDKFHMDGVSVARHGVDSMIGVELQTWLFKEFGVQISVQVLSNPNTTFRSLASLVAEHLYVAA